MSGAVIEAIEPEEFLGKALLDRVRNIPNYPLLGPPDLCYIVKEKRGGFMSSGPILRQGHYHYVYGVDTSSTAAPCAYIQSIVKSDKSDISSASKSKIRVTSATFCTFDFVSRRDVRIEIQFPGSTNVVAYDEAGDSVLLDPNSWNTVFVCSQIRSFYPKLCFVGRQISMFRNMSTFSDFMAVVKLLYQSNVLGADFI